MRFYSDHQFKMATADFSQMALGGIQYPSRFGFRVSNGGFIFFWDDTKYRKMCLTKNDGTLVKGGFLNQPADNWKNPSAWTPDVGYTVSNFRGYKGGMILYEDYSVTLLGYFWSL